MEYLHILHACHLFPITPVTLECPILTALYFTHPLPQQISFYEVFPNYEIIMFATEVKKIVEITDYKMPDITTLQLLDNYTYDGKFGPFAFH